MSQPIKEKILIAEDHPATRRLLIDILEDDYQVLAAADGTEALKLAAEHPDIDLILLDIIMPGQNGYEVCALLKDSPATAIIPIIFLTVLSEETDESKGFELGVNDYIIKPVSRTRLKTRIKNQLDMKKQRDLIAAKNQELTEAMEQIKTLRGFLPICSFCKQIRNDKGYWQQVEEYIRTHSEAVFTHSVCPECIKKHYSELQL